jgi:hypothetical protein
VGLDGGYVHVKEQKSRMEGWFEVIVGKSLPQEGAAKCPAFVQKYDQKPKRRLYDVLQAQGVQANQSVIFLSAGGEQTDGKETTEEYGANAARICFCKCARKCSMETYASGSPAGIPAWREDLSR